MAIALSMPASNAWPENDAAGGGVATHCPLITPHHPSLLFLFDLCGAKLTKLRPHSGPIGGHAAPVEVQHQDKSKTNVSPNHYVLVNGEVVEVH